MKTVYQTVLFSLIAPASLLQAQKGDIFVAIIPSDAIKKDCLSIQKKLAQTVLVGIFNNHTNPTNDRECF